MYCLDTNVLINSWHFWYSPQTHPTFWTGLDALAQARQLGIPAQVYEELVQQHDELFEWCRDRKEGLVIPASEQTEHIFAELADSYPDLIGELGMGSSYADLYLIATAESVNGIVVTMEEFSSSANIRKWKIPNLCRERGIEFIQPYELIRREGWVFNH